MICTPYLYNAFNDNPAQWIHKIWFVRISIGGFSRGYSKWLCQQTNSVHLHRAVLNFALLFSRKNSFLVRRFKLLQTEFHFFRDFLIFKVGRGVQRFQGKLYFWPQWHWRRIWFINSFFVFAGNWAKIFSSSSTCVPINVTMFGDCIEFNLAYI